MSQVQRNQSRVSRHFCSKFFSVTFLSIAILLRSTFLYHVSFFIFMFQVNDIKFHPVHGTLATVGSDGRYSFWDKDVRIKLKTSDPMEQSITNCAFNGDGQIFAYSVSYDWSKVRYSFFGETHPFLLFSFIMYKSYILTIFVLGSRVFSTSKEESNIFAPMLRGSQTKE